MLTYILAAGDSKRFANSPYAVLGPKQFIPFSVAPGAFVAQMWENTVVGTDCIEDLTLVIRTDHAPYLRPPVYHRRTRVHWLNKPTAGQAETLLLAMEETPNEEIMVVNCDQGFAPGLLDRLVSEGRSASMPAALTFKAGPEEATRWSYVEDHPLFFDAEEKKAIGPMALAGAYYFPDSRLLKQCLILATSWATKNGTEPYISGVYGFMPKNKLSVEIRREDCYDWGTPEAFERFNRP